MNAFATLNAGTRPLPRGKAAGLSIAVAVFTVAYISWRPFEILFTLSDAFFCIGFVALIRAGRLPLRPFGSLTGPWFLCTALMLTGLFLGSLVNGDLVRWFIVALQYVFSLVFLPLLLAPSDQEEGSRLLLIFVAGIAAMQALGAAVYFLFPGDFAQINAQFGHSFISGVRRLGAFLGDANWNAAMCAMALPSVIYLMIIRRIGRWTGTLLMGVLATGTLLSGSFTGFASATISVLLISMSAGARRSLQYLMAGGVAATLYLVSGAPLPDAFAKRVAPALEQGDISAAGTFIGRWELIEEAWDVTSQTTFIGLGVDQYRVVSIHQAPVHNIYLLLWTEGGMLALVGWLGLLLIAAGITILAAARDRVTGGLAASILVVFMIQTTANPHMYARMWVVPLLIVMGLAFNACRRNPAPVAFGTIGRSPR